jgi:hypothetical protein
MSVAATRKRRVRKPPDLTSLFDVLFIVVFVALIRAAAAQQSAAAAVEAAKPVEPPKPAAPASGDLVGAGNNVPMETAALKKQALANVASELAGRSVLIVRINDKGVVTQLETEGKKLPLDVPLLAHDPDPTIRLAYQGDRSAQLRACRVAALQLGVQDLAKHLVIFAPARARVDLPHALISGLERDIARCLADQQAIATIVQPVAVRP